MYLDNESLTFEFVLVAEDRELRGTAARYPTPPSQASEGRDGAMGPTWRKCVRPKSSSPLQEDQGAGALS